jgi:hypothetical protein
LAELKDFAKRQRQVLERQEKALAALEARVPRNPSSE